MKILFVIILLIAVLLIFIVRQQRVYVVSFAHNCCEKAQKNLEKTALKYGATKVFSLNLDTLEAPDDVKEYIKNNERGAGYWIWKPYALKQVLSVSNPDDIVIYVDSSTFFEKSVQPIVDEINKNSILCFDTGHDNQQNAWTKMNAVKHFGHSDDWCTTDGVKPQFMATLLGVKNDTLGNTIVNKWLDVLIPSNSHLFDDSDTSGNCTEFKESRHDQQMLSLILYKYVPHIKFPEYDKNIYGWVFHHEINGNDRHL